MKFWVYENNILSKARVHRADCSFCADGRGLHAVGDTYTGKWLGPFEELSEAFVAARNTGQSDMRACLVCLIATAEGATPGKSYSMHPVGSETCEWDVIEKIECSLQVLWTPKGRVTLDIRGKIKFPSVPSSGGLYRFKTRYPDGRFAIYIGESDNLQRRFSNYRNPGPTQQTSLRINKWIVELLSSSGDISVSIVQSAKIITHASEVGADFSQKSVRMLFEQQAISMQNAADIEVPQSVASAA